MGKTKMDYIQILIKETTLKMLLTQKPSIESRYIIWSIKGEIKVNSILMYALKWDNIGTGLRVYVFERRKVNSSLLFNLNNISQGV